MTHSASFQPRARAVFNRVVISAVGGLLWSLAAQSETSLAPLPEPLTLEHALALGESGHPELEQAQAELDLARARVDGADSATGLNISVQGRARYIEPSDRAEDQSHDDHVASLFVRKRLYDFGRSGGALDAASFEFAGQESRLLSARAARRLDVMARFFEVLLADIRNHRDYEIMSIAYVRYDHTVKRKEQGQASDIDVAERHSRYQDTRRVWYESTAEQRSARARLARAMNWSGPLPSRLAEPARIGAISRLPEAADLHEQALQSNPELVAARERVRAQEERVRSARAGHWPTLDAELEVSEYTRDLAGRDKLRASLILDIPLYSGGKVSAEVDAAQAELRRARATLAARESEIRLAIAEVYDRLTPLHIQRDEARALTEYRELYLDRSRMVYEQEMRTDLGDAMILTVEAQLRTAETEFAIALALARLEALVGKPIEMKDGERK